jgi:hypothetical protein
MFDPVSFLDAEVKGANSTEIVPIPIDEYPGTVKKVDVKTGTSDKTGEPWARLELMWTVDDPDLAAKLNRKEVTVRQQIMLDLTDSGTMDMAEGRNVRLGRLRDALSLNDKSKPFSLRMFEGRSAKISVKQETYKDQIQNYVDAVVKS